MSNPRQKENADLTVHLDTQSILNRINQYGNEVIIFNRLNQYGNEVSMFLLFYFHGNHPGGYLILGILEGPPAPLYVEIRNDQCFVGSEGQVGQSKLP